VKDSVGQAALEKQPILLQNVPDDYIQITSGLGEAPPRNIIVLPVLFEGEVKAVIELRSFLPFSQIHQTFLDQLAESIGVVLNMIGASMRTEELLEQSQKLTQELQSQSQELQQQQNELKRSNTELEAQAKTLRQSEELLKEQQEELQQVNEELEEKAVIARRAESEGRAEESRGGRRASLARREGRATRDQRQVQERVPGEHEPRAAYAAQLAAHPGQAALR
jgi:septal ring factor EnvC (AmiA/AmiB activator)